MTDVEWLQEWYAAHCDGEWEHQYGVFIDNIDNPGWRFVVDLADTELMARSFDTIKHDLASNVSWWVCKVAEMKFDAVCGSRDLMRVIAIFRAWAEQPNPTPSS